MEAIEMVEPMPSWVRAYSYIRTTSRAPAKCAKWVREHEPMIRSFIDDHLSLRGAMFAGYFRDESDDGLLPIAKRPAGAKLCERLQAGDWVVVWDFEHAFANQGDLTAMLKHWDVRAINWHVLNLVLPMGRDAAILGLLLELSKFENRMAKFSGALSLHPMHSTLIGVVGAALERGDDWVRIAGELNGRGLRTMKGEAWCRRGAATWWRLMGHYGKRPLGKAPLTP